MSIKYLIVNSIKVDKGFAYEVIDYKTTFEEPDETTFRKVLILSNNSFQQINNEQTLPYAGRYLKVIQIGWWEDIAKHQ